MIDKYREIVLYEINNGWILKIVKPDNPNEINQISYESFYCKNYNEINKILKEEIKEKL